MAAVLALPVSNVDPIRDAQWHLTYLNVAQAHEINQGDGVTVAVIDSGVDGGHPDLNGSFVSGADLTYQGPGDGLIDVDGHGTSMAGIIAAHGRVLGIAPHAKIQSVRAEIGSFASTTKGAGIEWAIEHGAKVLCIASSGNDNVTLRDAVTRALEADIVVVAAAGNLPRDREVRFPAAYAGVLAVAGTDRSGGHADFSVTGPEIIIAAPAVQIMSTYLRNATYGGYAPVDGTSASTAIVAGAAALLRSRYPNLSAAEVVHRLTATADDKGIPGWDYEYGSGVVNLVKALTADVPPLQATVGVPTSTTPNATNAVSPRSEEDSGSGIAVLTIGLIVAVLLAAGGYLIWRGRTTT